MDPRAQTVILPVPMNVMVLGALLALLKSGIVDLQATVRFTRQPCPRGTPMITAGGRVINLLTFNAHEEPLRTSIDWLLRRTRRWATFFCFGKGQYGYDQLRCLLSRQPLQNFNGSSALLRGLCSWIDENREAINPWKVVAEDAFPWWDDLFATLFPRTGIVSSRCEEEPAPPDKRYVHLPYFSTASYHALSNPELATRPAVSTVASVAGKQEGGDPALPDSEIEGTIQVELEEGRILRLLGCSIAIGIGGIPNSGKSTLCVSLAAEMDAIMRSLKSRAGWPEIPLTVGALNLDLATPTVDAIASGEGKDRETLKAVKRPRTDELAEEARIRLQDARGRYSIVICDLPGGGPDDVTSVIAAGLDAGIIITRDWEAAMKLWPNFFRSLGVKVISRVRSRLPHEGFSSLATHRKPGEKLSGRVSGLFRSAKARDRFVEYLALFLLFEILPNLYGSAPSRSGIVGDQSEPSSR